MLKLNNIHDQVTVTPTLPAAGLETAPRFIIPVPSPEADLTSVTRRVWELANATGAHVLVLGLCTDALQEPALRRALATMTAMLSYGRVSAQSDIAFGRNWVEAVRSHIQAGDTLVCWHDQCASLFQSRLNIPLYFLSGLSPKKEPRTNWPAQAMAWIGSLLLLAGFFFLQVEIQRFAGAWTVLLEILSLAGELGSIWLWNSLFR